MIDAATREVLGRAVREEWIAWAREQPSPTPSWLVPWEELSEPDREVDRRIGEKLALRGASAMETVLVALVADMANEPPVSGKLRHEGKVAACKRVLQLLGAPTEPR